jgi:type II secretory pathway pseudopilin PulG
MTLLEILVATAVLAVVVISTMAFMVTFRDSTAQHSASTNLIAKTDSAISQMGRELRSSFLYADWHTALNAGDTVVPFVRAIDLDQDGDTVDDQLDPEWAVVREDAGVVAYLPSAASTDPSAQFAFVQDVDGGGAPRQFDESVRNIDLNRDGDISDTFQIGHIELQYPAGTYDLLGGGVTNLPAWNHPITGDIVVIDNADGDFDDDGDADPIFQLNGSALRIDLWVAQTEMAQPVVQEVTTTIDLRNVDPDG